MTGNDYFHARSGLKQVDFTLICELEYPKSQITSRSGIRKTVKVTKTTTTNIGKYIRDRRKVAGLTQRALGDLAGVGARFVSELERDKPTVRLDAVNKVLAVFGKRLGLTDMPRGGETP